eukprot:TRINITY_DN27884_c0_g1_i2.p1 TRINITY_DN27884_c0_g1~~TRINITY_DN27884_c0_g1_i2.p1  ORF type:complete len:210 (-),score=48.03 TRINITY_DN27884_c0_g1_i2:194-823(-)
MVMSALTSHGMDAATLSLHSQIASLRDIIMGDDDKIDGLNSEGKPVDGNEVLAVNNVFLSHDLDSSGMLDEREVEDYLHSVRAPRSLSWKGFDIDEDGKLSKHEFWKLNVADWNLHMHTNEADEDLSALLDFEERADIQNEVPEEFADMDASFLQIKETLDHFLDEANADSLNSHLPAGLHWRAFDTNFDGQLSHAELAQLLSTLETTE